MARESFAEYRVRPPNAAGTLLWDGECGFCARWVDALHRISKRPVDTRPVQAYAEALPEAVRAAAEHQVLWISGDGRVSGGVAAIAEALRVAGCPWLGRLLTNTAVAPLARAVYRWVARNRHRLAGSGSACVRPR